MRHFMIRTVGLCVLMAAIAHSTAFSQGGGSTNIVVKPGTADPTPMDKINYPTVVKWAWGAGEYDYAASGGFILHRVTSESGTVDSKGVFTSLSGPDNATVNSKANPKTWELGLLKVGLASGQSRWFRGRLREIHTTTMEVRTAAEATGKYEAP